MDYGKLFSRAWDLIWKHKFLILLGVLVALGGAGGGGGSQGMNAGGSDFNFQQPPQFDFHYDLTRPFQGLDLPVLAVGGILVLVLIFVLIGLVMWVISTTARGGLIHGANQVSQEKESSFGESFQAGWRKIWRLIGIGLVPALPALLLGVLALVSLGMYSGISVIQGPGMGLDLPRMGVFAPAVVLSCVLVPLILVLSLLRTFANRACMLENLGVFASYRRGAEVLGANLGSALILFLLQLAISIGIAVVMFLPGILIALCCFLWPLLLLVQGTFVAFYSTLWTLAWNQWTGVPEVVEDSQVSAA